jgi:prolycopene isomerase
MPEKYDVIVIGAGIGGLAAGAALSKKGKKVLVLEKIPIPGGCSVNFQRGRFEFDASKEENKIKEFFNLMIRIFNRIWNIGEDKIPPADFINYVDKTCQDVFDMFGISEKVSAIISQLWPFLGLPPKQLSFFIFVSTAIDYTYNGGYYPKGGAQAIANALSEVIRENGSTIIFSNAVKKILIKDQAAYGVTTKNGNEYFADKIISNINPYTTFYNLIGKEFLPAAFLEKMSKMEPSISAIHVYLGLNTDPRNVGVTDYTVFLNENYDLNSQYIACLNNNANEMPIEISFHNLLDGSENSPQKDTMSIVAMAGFDYWQNFTREEYVKRKMEMADILINRAERIFPKLSSCIEKIEVATPKTIVKFTGNYKGAIYGWSQILSQSGKRRMRQKTIIENLFLSGAWTEPVGGVTGVMQSGVMAASKILHKEPFK